ncbi:GNAT family N-acetyltransferase [Dactylosporangium sp. NPDC005572]|uniref:GNAT family N-acetyltransferase n=1 Tax=Dactylosporangium sp. NPDC005572 TaxID=3156889 RepID=UPI0033A2A6DC
MFVRSGTGTDLPWINSILTASYGVTTVVTGDRIRNAAELATLVAENATGPVGLLTYEAGPEGLEVVTIDTSIRRIGAGTALLSAARDLAARSGLRRVWLITTNDNLDALRFYQRRGMRIVRVHPGAVDRARLHKPAIPAAGSYGIALHDELELEFPAAVSVRPAGLGTVPAVLSLLDAATRWLVSLGRTGQWGTAPHSANPRRRAQLTSWAATGGLWLAELSGRPVGALAVGTAPDYVPAATEPELYVNLLVTDRTHRGAGLGTALLDHARVLAVGRGVERLRVDCYAGDDRALVGWYERQGFTATDPFAVALPDGTAWPGQVLTQSI